MAHALDSAWPGGLLAAVAVAAWYVTLQALLRAFLPTLAERLRPKKPSRWRVVGDYRLPLNPMFWIDVAALACGIALAIVGTRFWPVAACLVVFGVVRLGDRFDVFSER